MMTIELADIFQERHLAVREASHRLDGPLQELEGDHLIIQFEGIRGVSPSFLDEMMGEITSLPQADEWLVVTFKSVPMERTDTVERIMEGRGGDLKVLGDDEWQVTFGEEPSSFDFWRAIRERLFPP